MRRIALFWMAACNPTDPVDVGMGARCSLDTDNPLRGMCWAHATSPAPLTLSYGEAGQEPRVIEQAPARTHEVRLWGMRPGATYEVEIVLGGTRWQGELEPTLPDVLAPITVEVVDTEDAVVDLVLGNVECGASLLVVIDRNGNVIWYEDVSDFGSQVNAISQSDGTGVLAILDRRRVVDVAYEGTRLHNWGPDVLGDWVHHEVMLRDELIWVMTAEEWHDPETGNAWVADGLRAFEGDGTVVVDWDVSQVLDLTVDPWAPKPGYWRGEMPDAYETLHGNSAFRDEDGGWYLSLKYKSQLLHLDAGPNGGPGELRWVLAGDGSGDFALDPEEQFAQQHHFRKRHVGDIGLFDNGLEGTDSRAIELSLDESTGDAVLTADFPLPLFCKVSGSIFGLDGDHVLVTCADHHTFFEFDVGGRIVWEAHVQCDLGEMRPIVRGVPVETLFPDEPIWY